MQRIVHGSPRENALGSLVIQGSLRLSRLAVFIAAAALLTPTAFAAVALALAITDLIRGGLQAFDVGAVRQLARGGVERRTVQRSLDGKGLTGAIALLLGIGFAALVYDPGTLRLVAISGVGTIAAAFGSSFFVERQAALALHSIAGRVAFASAAGAALAILLGSQFRTASGVVTGVALGDVLLLLLVQDLRVWRRPSWPSAVEQIRDTASLMTMQLAHVGQFRIGTLVLGAFGSAVAVGEYTIASRMTEGLVVLAAALTSSSLPLMGAAHAQDERDGLVELFGASYGIGIRVVAPLVMVLVLSAPLWIALLFPAYPNAGPATAIVGLSIVIFFASSQTTALLNATDHDRAASRSAVTGLIVSTAGSFAALPFGAAGVAWARAGGEATRLLVETAAGRRYFRIPAALVLRPWLEILPVGGAAALALAGQWRAPHIWIGIGIGVAGSLLLLIASRRSGDSRG